MVTLGGGGGCLCFPSWEKGVGMSNITPSSVPVNTGVQNLALEYYVKSDNAAARVVLRDGRAAVGVGIAGAGGQSGVNLGLSYVTYRAAGKETAPDYLATMFDGAALMQFKPIRGEGARKRSRVARPRGVITGLSAGSRSRLLQEINRVRKVQLVKGVFVTLTYPGDFERWSVKDTKRHLRALFKRIMRRWPGAAGLWKLEPQQRGAPHYHVCVLGVEFIPHEWLAEVWYEIVGSGDLRHLAAGSQVERVKSYKAALSYLGKYLSKDKNTLLDPRPGRFWGTFGPVKSFYGEKVVFEMSGGQAVEMFRVLDKYRVAAARRPVGKRYTPERRARAIMYSRRRRAGLRQGRFYVADVGQLMRWFLEGVLHE